MIFTLASCVLGTFAKRGKPLARQAFASVENPIRMNFNHFEFIFAFRARKASKTISFSVFRARDCADPQTLIKPVENA